MSKRIKEIIVRYDDKQSFIYGNTLGEVVGELVRCGECIYWKNSLCQAWHRVIPKDGYCSIGEKDVSTQTETQNSNLTFEKVQTQIIEFPDTHQKFIFARKIETDSDSIKIGNWQYKGVKDGEREGE